MVENNTHIGRFVTIQTSSYVTAYMSIEDHVFIGPCFSTSNDKYMGMKNEGLQGPVLKKDSKMGNNATFLPGIIIGKQATVGAGSVVTKHDVDGEIGDDNPAKKIK